MVTSDEFLTQVFHDPGTRASIYLAICTARDELRSPRTVRRLIEQYEQRNRLFGLSEALRIDLRRGLPNVPFEQLEPDHLRLRARDVGRSGLSP